MIKSTVKKLIRILITSVASCATLVVNAQVTLSTTQVDVVCNGANTGSIDLTISGGQTPYSIQWSNGSQLEDLNNLAAGQYTVDVTDANGLIANTSVNISEPSAVAVTAGSDHTFCSGGDATLDASVAGGVGPYSYLWLCNSPDCFLDNNTIQSPLANPTQSRTYYVLTTDANGCSSNMDSLTVTVNQTPNLTITSDTAIIIGESIQLEVLPGFHPTFDWQPDMHLDNNTIFTPISTPDEEITYTVTVISAEGCVASDSVTIAVNPVPTVGKHTVNNLFTPNGDGSNDFWSVHTKDNASVDVVVFNRWGKEVYSQRNYQDDWDGTSNGSPLPEATYYYVITIEGEDEKLSGSVSIVRLK